MNRRQCSTAGGVMGWLIGFTPLSVTAMAPVEAHLILVSQKAAPATVVLPSASVPEHPLAGTPPPVRCVRLFQRMSLRGRVTERKPDHAV
jgi:hypothetical protein